MISVRHDFSRKATWFFIICSVYVTESRAETPEGPTLEGVRYFRRTHLSQILKFMDY